MKQTGTEPKDRGQRAFRLATYVIALACLVGGTWRLIALNAPPDRDVLFFFLAAVVVLLSDSITKFRFGAMEFERKFETLEERLDEFTDVARDLSMGKGADASDALMGAEPEFNERVKQLATAIYKPGLLWDDDPTSEIGNSAVVGGNQLAATVRPSKNYPRRFHATIDLSVNAGVADADDPRVAFFLHHSFHERTRILPLIGGSVSFSLLTVGCFTVGVLLPDGTKLALDLSRADLSALDRQQRRAFLDN